MNTICSSDRISRTSCGRISGRFCRLIEAVTREFWLAPLLAKPSRHDRDTDDPRAAGFAVLDWLGYLQSELLEVMMKDTE